MKRSLFTMILLAATSAFAASEKPAEIYCTIRDGGQGLNCQWNGKDKKVMSADDVATFVDEAAVMAYVTVKSKAGMERTFMPDPKALPFKRLSDAKKGGSASEISRAKLDVFAELEKRMIKVSNDLDTQASQTDLVKYDASITYDKMKKDMREQSKDLDLLKGNKEKLCTTTPEFEALSKTNSSLQTALSNVLVAFQTPGTCMDSFKIFKDRDGTVDLRQLDGVGKHFIDSCKKR